jgi:LuxR family maltose regulon positive regulatory protein
VLAGAGPVLLLPGPAAELEPVLARFPASRYVNDAAVAGALAAAGLRTGDPSAAALHIGNAERALHRCPPAHRGAVETWLQALRLMNADPDARDLAEQSRAIAQAAESQAPSAGSQQALGLLWSALGVSALAQMDVRQATAAFASAAGYLRDGAHREFGAQVRGWQALAEALAGNLSAAWDLASQDANAGDPLAAALADLALAHVHWARDEAAAGLQALDRHDTGGQARPGGHLAAGRVLSVQATSARARLALGDGDQAAAGAALARLRYQCAQAGGAALNLALASVDADVALSEGDVRRARTMVARACAEGGGTRPDVRLAGARVALADGDCPAVLSALDPYLAAAGPLYDQVCALIMAAVCERRLGQADQAAAHLGLALALAEPHRLYRPFLDGGAAARSALTVLISPVSQGAAFAARILQRFDADPARPGRQSDAVRLTSSELAVLRFLPTHMTNQEIAESLYLSVNTVKTHLRSVYRKFGVTTRRQAISRGGRLGLL